MCGASCVDTQSDAKHCGGCNIQCPTGVDCVSGTCDCPTAGDIACGGACIDPSTSFANCGGCGQSCDPLYESQCTGGTCDCKAGLTHCGNRCRDLASDPNHCGDCGMQCGSSQACVSGTCVCRPGLTNCNGKCVDLQSDPDHCGACTGAGALCQQDERCSQGSCTTSSCATPDSCQVSNNRRACVNFDTDPLNCGDCGQKCDRDKLCVQGNCETFSPATGCNSCPCNAVCDDLVGGSAACCDIPSLGADAYCVENGCP
jgi:hypothetical protein